MNPALQAQDAGIPEKRVKNVRAACRYIWRSAVRSYHRQLPRSEVTILLPPHPSGEEGGVLGVLRVPGTRIPPSAIIIKLLSL